MRSDPSRRRGLKEIIEEDIFKKFIFWETFHEQNLIHLWNGTDLDDYNRTTFRRTLLMPPTPLASPSYNLWSTVSELSSRLARLPSFGEITFSPGWPPIFRKLVGLGTPLSEPSTDIFRKGGGHRTLVPI